jgi:hypothetical protein
MTTAATDINPAVQGQGLIGSATELPEIVIPEAVKSNIGATTRQVGRKETAVGQIEDITAADSPLMQNARNKAKAYANERGLVNSAMAGGWGEQAVLETATPLALNDAQTQARQELTNQDATNQFSMVDKNFDNTVSLNDRTFGQQRTLSQDEIRARTAAQAREFGQQTFLQKNELDNRVAQQEKDLASLKERQQAEFGQQTALQQTELANRIAQQEKDLAASKERQQADINATKERQLAEFGQQTTLQKSELDTRIAQQERDLAAAKERQQAEFGQQSGLQRAEIEARIKQQEKDLAAAKERQTAEFGQQSTLQERDAALRTALQKSEFGQQTTIEQARFAYGQALSRMDNESRERVAAMSASAQASVAMAEIASRERSSQLASSTQLSIADKELANRLLVADSNAALQRDLNLRGLQVSSLNSYTNQITSVLGSAMGSDDKTTFVGNLNAIWAGSPYLPITIKTTSNPVSGGGSGGGEGGQRQDSPEGGGGGGGGGSGGYDVNPSAASGYSGGPDPNATGIINSATQQQPQDEQNQFANEFDPYAEEEQQRNRWGGGNNTA